MDATLLRSGPIQKAGRTTVEDLSALNQLPYPAMTQVKRQRDELKEQKRWLELNADKGPG